MIGYCYVSVSGGIIDVDVVGVFQGLEGVFWWGSGSGSTIERWVWSSCEEDSFFLGIKCFYRLWEEGRDVF